MTGGENSSGDAGVTYYPVLEPDFFEESNKSANFTPLNFIEELNQDPSVQVEPFQSSIEEVCSPNANQVHWRNISKFAHFQ